jgi:glycosyltransferase involved in cell wall biosynthesis
MLSNLHPKRELVSSKESEEGSAVSTSASVSVIIPTFNRKDLLRETLASLAQQTCPSDRFEVIVVDDGSTDGTAAIEAESFPFALRYFRQSNQGDAAARNLGARQSRASILVFLDDDILLDAGYLGHILQAHDRGQDRIVVGTCNLWLTEETPFSQSIHVSNVLGNLHPGTELAFTDVYSNNMSLRREAYFKIGTMRDLDFPGSSMWCDLDFGYRAYLQGFEFCRSTKAICWHRDHVVASLDAYKKRVRTAGYRAVVLFQRYPELLAHIPMFYDKVPIAWGKDSPRRIARKLARAVASSRLALWSMEEIAHALEKLNPVSALLPALYRYIIGGYMFRGYREGLDEFGPIRQVASHSAPWTN